MKKVSGYISVRPIGSYKFEFFVNDGATTKEIEERIDEELQMSMGYTVEEGYEAVQETVYKKN